MESIINAIIEDNYDYFVELIHQKGADITDQNGFTPLMYCIQHERSRMIAFLLQHSIDINKINRVGNSALFYAVFQSKNNTDLIEKLLEKGADMYLTNNAGISPLSLADSMANEQVKIFLQSRADTA